MECRGAGFQATGWMVLVSASAVTLCPSLLQAAVKGAVKMHGCGGHWMGIWEREKGGMGWGRYRVLALFHPLCSVPFPLSVAPGYLRSIPLFALPNLGEDLVKL